MSLPRVPVIEQQHTFFAPGLNAGGLFSLRGGFDSLPTILKWLIGQTKNNSVESLSDLSLSGSPWSSLRAKTGPDLVSALCLLGQLLR